MYKKRFQEKQFVEATIHSKQMGRMPASKYSKFEH